MGRYRVGEWPGDQCAMKTLCASRAHNEMKDQWPWGVVSLQGQWSWLLTLQDQCMAVPSYGDWKKCITLSNHV